MWLTYTYELGLKVGSTALPDPKAWNYQVGDLDTSGSRDATGWLHRARVAQKINYEFEWEALEWEMLQRILTAISGDRFTFTGPDPRTFKGTYTGTYYVGDRTGGTHYYRPDSQEIAIYSLKLKFIEY